METFTWPVSFGTSKSTAPTVKRTQFGDGYSQRVPEGINPSPGKWSVRMNSVPNAEADAVEAFLKARGGAEAFWWTPPGAGSPITVICPEWTRPHNTAVVSDISASFEQVFDY